MTGKHNRDSAVAFMIVPLRVIGTLDSSPLILSGSLVSVAPNCVCSKHSQPPLRHSRRFGSGNRRRHDSESGEYLCPPPSDYIHILHPLAEGAMSAPKLVTKCRKRFVGALYRFCVAGLTWYNSGESLHEVLRGLLGKVPDSGGGDQMRSNSGRNCSVHEWHMV